MYGIGFYDEYLKRMGNLKDKSDMAISQIMIGSKCSEKIKR